MPHRRSKESKQALARIQRLCCLGIGSEMLMPHLMREVTKLVPSRGGLFYWLGPDFEFTNCYTTYSPSLAELYFKEFNATRAESALLRPLCQFKGRPMSNSVVQLGEHLVVDPATFLRSDLYNLIYRPADIYDTLILLVRETGRTYGSLQLHRSPREPPFEPRHVKMLKSIAAFLAHGMTRAVIGEETFADGDGDSALFITDRDGRLRHVGAQAQHLLMMALNPCFSRTADWRNLGAPIPEIAQLCCSLSTVAEGEVEQFPPCLRLRNPWGEFVFRAYWFGPTDGAEQVREICITIERRLPRALALQRRVEYLPLTGREKQVCLLLAHGRSRRDLADAMGVAIGTIITHRSRIYAKLGVHSRAELLAALLPG